MPDSPQPTLLVFTRGPGRECSKRRLLPARHSETEVELHARCLRSVVEAGLATDCHVVVSCPTPLELDSQVTQVRQHGRSLGERLRNAVLDLQQRADGPVIVVGSDIPQLGVGQLRETLGVLRRGPNEVVVGPSPDGGFYLLAGSGSLDSVLSQVQWHSSAALSSLLVALEEAGRRVTLLESLRDLDRTADLLGWLASSTSRAWDRLLHVLRRVVRHLAHVLDPMAMSQATGFPSRPVGRSPPC